MIHGPASERRSSLQLIRNFDYTQHVVDIRDCVDADTLELAGAILEDEHPRKLVLDGYDISPSLEFLADLPPLDILQVSGLAVPKMQGLRHQPSLQALYIGGAKYPMSVGEVSSLINLKHLFIGQRTKDTEAIAGCSRLRSLAMIDGRLEGWVTSLVGLVKLSANNARCYDYEVLAPLMELRHLELIYQVPDLNEIPELPIEFLELQAIRAASLSGIEKQRALRYLYLKDNKKVRAIDGLIDLPRLEEVRFRGVRLTNEEIESLESAPSLLRVLFENATKRQRRAIDALVQASAVTELKTTDDETPRHRYLAPVFSAEPEWLQEHLL